MNGRWRVQLTAAAEADLREILRWTAERFGEAQTRAYADTVNAAIAALTAGPDVAGARSRDDIAKGLMALHVARGGHKGRHFVIYRAAIGEPRPTIDVLRLLHDSMDIPRHIDPAATKGN